MKTLDVQKILNQTFVGNVIHVLKHVPNHAIDVRGYADFAPMGHSVRVRREEEKGTISWKIKFRNGTTKDFVSPITTKPWGKFIPKLADGDKPNQGEINSQRLYTEPEGLNIDGELPVVPKESFKKGVYY
jgi:adenylylsulfate reductase subunit B